MRYLSRSADHRLRTLIRVFLLMASLLVVLPSLAGAGEKKVLSYCTSRPDRCAISVLAPTDGWEAHLNPDRPQTLASTYKTLMLLAYADAVASGAVNEDRSVPREDWARYLTLDGGAFEHSWDELGRPDQARLDDMVGMMIRFSDNATPDWLSKNLKKKFLKRAVKEFGFHDLPLPLSAHFGLWRNGNGEGGGGDRVAADYGGWDVKGYQQEAKRLFNSFSRQSGVDSYRKFLCIQPPWGASPPPCEPPTPATTVQSLRVLNRSHFNRSTSRSYAEVMRQILDGSLLSAAAQEVVDRHLEVWLEIFPSLSPAFSRYGLKGGSLGNATGPTVLTWAHYMEASGHQYVVVVFLQGLSDGGSPPDTGDVNAFAQKIALDAGFRTEVRNAMDADDTRPELVPKIKRVQVSGNRVTVKASVINTSPNTMEGSMRVSLILTDGRNGSNDVELKSLEVGPIRPYKRKNLTLSGTAPQDPSGLLALVHVDPDDDVGEQDEENNLLWERID